ncbi:hypothetical protein [Ottowia sp.]|uniref:hypothetical protein n=1 Tax=Ottowia sp. TaxID=1898956 RepID=UPI0025D41425|nr:hypothetical protein [Ottowia sp.]MBK6616100.1 hypothetical protein [Ottowia sp.]
MGKRTWRRVAAIVVSIMISSFSFGALGAEPAAASSVDNARLAALFAADQDDRKAGPTEMSGFDWKGVEARDKERVAALREMLKAGLVRTAADFRRASNIFQHADAADGPRLAHALATISASMDPANKEARWLMAASWDRLMMRMDRPQWYGTQFVRKAASDPWSLGDVDASVTDAERASYFVPPLAEMRKHIEEMNRADPPK